MFPTYADNREVERLFKHLEITKYFLKETISYLYDITLAMTWVLTFPAECFSMVWFAAGGRVCLTMMAKKCCHLLSDFWVPSALQADSDSFPVHSPVEHVARHCPHFKEQITEVRTRWLTWQGTLGSWASALASHRGLCLQASRMSPLPSPASHFHSPASLGDTGM